MAIITLTTDFGSADWFVGSLKGVMLKIEPHAVVVDITHEIAPGDVRAAAFVLAAAYQAFPRKTVHLAVVDPGVGSGRAALAVRTDGYYFVGPDNGVLSLALARENIQEIRQLTNEVHYRPPVSATFHGRDIFAPVAARLTQGILVDSLGPVQSDYVRLDWPKPQPAGNGLAGEVIHVDRFGNAITNLDTAAVGGRGPGVGKVSLPGGEIVDVRRFYRETAPGQPLALIGSTGFLEVAINGGCAAESLHLKVGDRVELR